MIQFKDYQITDLLGQGGTSDVYLAFNSFGEKKALKVLRGQLIENEEAVSRFLREFELAAVCLEERLVKIDEASSTHDGRPLLVMEYLDGTTLAQFKNDIPPEARALAAMALLSEILKGLESLHEVGLIHRDLKLENIFLLKDGKIKISDFGISRALAQTTITHTGAFLGSPQYMSPEHIKGEPSSIQSDLYAVGVLGFALATGHFPYESDTFEGLMGQIIHKPLNRAELINPYLPLPLVYCLEKALSKESKNSYEQAIEFRAEILKCLRDLSNLPASTILKNYFHRHFENITIDRAKIKKAIMKRKGEKDPRWKQQEKILSPHYQDPEKKNKKFLAIISLIGFIVFTVFFIGNKEKNQIKKVVPLTSSDMLPIPIHQTFVKADPKPNIVSASPSSKILLPSLEKSGRLLINVPKEVKVFVDNKKWNYVGIAHPYPSGIFEIIFVRDGHPAYVEKIEIKKGEVTKINVN